MKGKIRFFQVFLVVLFLVIGKVTFADIKVYDANDEYLGILIDNASDELCLTIYIPSVEKFMTIRKDTGQVNDYCLYCSGDDCSGNLYVNAIPLNHILENSGKYYVTEDAAPMEVTYNSINCHGTCYNADDPHLYHFPNQLSVAIPVNEIPSSQIPFTLPVALPLRFELGKTGDFDGDGDVDGADLAEFAKIYGK